jgi:hypothetical protein
MKHCASALTILLALACTPLLGQSTEVKNLPPGFVDGSKSPAGIPDRAAYRLVFMSLAVTAPGDQKQIAKQEVLLRRIGLSDADNAAMKQALVTFATAYSDWKQRVGAGATNEEAWAIVTSMRDSLQTQLTADGNTKLAEYVGLAKRNMFVKP